MKKVEILQLRKDAPDRRYKIFEPYDRVVKEYGDVVLTDYYEVWSGYVDDDITLDNIFTMCNLNHPEGYKGHSLSISDIVVIEGKYYWYCDTFGWKEI